MATNRLDTLNFTFVRRPAPSSGPTSSDAYNDSMSEMANDLVNIASEWNNKLVPFMKTIPAGIEDTSVNAFNAGLDGRTLWVNSSASSTDEDLTYFDQVRDRPVTVHEAFQAVYTHVSDQVNQVREDIVDQATGLTTEQKNRIGANVFDLTQTSSALSLDGKSENNRLNVIQLAADLYGPTYQLGNDGATDLTNSVFAMVDALLALHNGNWADDVTLNHTGAFTATQGDVNTSAPGNDAYVGTPSDLEDDLNQIRTQIRNAKGTGSWLSTLPSLYGGGADSLIELLSSTSGSASKSASNPWGYSYTDVDGLETRIDAIRDFTGQDVHTDDSPTYTSTVYIDNGDDLEAAIGKLDNAVDVTSDEIATTSGLFDILTASLAATQAYVGQDDALDDTPTYSSLNFIDQGDPLEIAISDLDAELLTQSGMHVTTAVDIAGLTADISSLRGYVGQDNAAEAVPTFSSLNYISADVSLEIAVGELDNALSAVEATATASDPKGEMYQLPGSGVATTLPDYPNFVTLDGDYGGDILEDFEQSGLYLVYRGADPLTVRMDLDLSGSVDTIDDYYFRVSVSDVALAKTEAHEYFGATGQVKNVGSNGLLQLYLDDTLDVQGAATTSGVNFTPSTLQLTVTKA